MIPDKVFHQILALGEAWRVASVDYVEPERRMLIRVEETLGLWAEQGCPHCANPRLLRAGFRQLADHLEGAMSVRGSG